MKGYFTSNEDREFCGRTFKAGQKYHIIRETEGHIIVKSKNCPEEQMMTKLWLKEGMFKFLDFHEEWIRLDQLNEYNGSKLCDICKDKTAQKESKMWIPPTSMNDSYRTTYYCNECYRETVRKNDKELKETVIRLMEEAIKKSDDPESIENLLEQYKQYNKWKLWKFIFWSQGNKK